MRVRSVAVLILVAAVVLGAAACGGGSNESSGNTTTASGGGSAGSGSTTLDLAADPNGALKFDKTSLEAPSGTVTIDFTNDSSTPHNVTVEGNGIQQKGTDTISQSNATLSLDLPPGTYTFFCSVPGHEDAGMKGTLTVK
jgi:plastocyanin